MKYPNARISTNNDGELYYVHLYSSNNKLNNVYLTSAGEELNWQTSELSVPEKEKLIYFKTKELAEQTLNKYNNMKTKRDYAALKQEGIDKKLCPPTHIYVGKGNQDYPLGLDWKDDNEKCFSYNICGIRSNGTIDDTGWEGSIREKDYCVPKEIWNKKFPNEKKLITLDEIKSQLTEAKKLIGKKIKRLKGQNSGKTYKVDEVNLHLEDPPHGEFHDKFFKENGYVISLTQNERDGSTSNTHFGKGAFQVIEDVKVILNSSYTAILSDSGIKVGCQTFPLDIIDKLVEARKQLI